MGATLIEQFDPSQILQPVQRPEIARQDTGKWAPNLTVSKGMAAARKTSDSLLYPMVPGASDGTQNFIGFAGMTFKTDANSNVYFGDSAAASWRMGPSRTAFFWWRGVFDPQELQTLASPVQQVTTFTPTTPTSGDVNTITFTDVTGTATAISFTATASTAANIAAGLIAAWNANATTAAVATASGTNTVILTTTIPGNTITTAGSVVGTGTLPKAATTAATGRSLADIQVACPGARVLANGFWDIP